MDVDDVYALTPSGEAELRADATRLAPEEIDVLVRVDGLLTLGEILSAMPAERRGPFMAAFENLRHRRLLSPVHEQASVLAWPTPAGSFGDPGASPMDAGSRSLQRRGYYVQIARERMRPREWVEGRRPMAVVIEDEPMLARFTETLLTLSGFDVRPAANRQEAVAQLNKRPVADIILLDVQLPDVDGFAILRSVRRNALLKDVPVIMLTGEATRQAVLAAIGGGADGYLTKPTDAAVLLRSVRAVLGMPDAAAPTALDMGAHPVSQAARRFAG